jgi:hypothetical protein
MISPELHRDDLEALIAPSVGVIRSHSTLIR